MEIEEKIKNSMKKYTEDEYERYVAEAGWQEWMQEYIEDEEITERERWQEWMQKYIGDEEITERESKIIEKIQRELWDEVHN